MNFPVGRRQGLAATAMCVVLAACSQPMDMDLRGLGEGFSTAGAAQQPTAERPRPDNRGVISYPSYQVAVAQPGDSVDTVAGRVGLPPAELASFNGLPSGVTFRGGEVLVLPRRVAEPSPATGAIATGPIQPGSVDVTTIATAALDRTAAAPAPAAAPVIQSGTEPLRHRVQRGETAFTIARLYNVTPRALADWNGLDSEFTVREGQYLLIPVAAGQAPAPAAVETAAATPPGSGSATPEPPSSATPLPPPPPPPAAAEEAEPESPELAEERTEASNPGQMMMPVDGSIIRPFVQGETDGIAISASAGAPVRAARNGTVAAISRDTNGVPIVVVRHEGNLLTIYSQVDDLTVEQGETVSRGDPIGRVRANDPAFLHFEVRQGFESVDPMPYLE